MLSTRWLSYDDIILLKKVEELVEVYYNSGQFVYSMMYLQKYATSSFELYEQLAAYYEEKNYAGLKLSRNKRYEILWEFAKEKLFAEKAVGNTASEMTTNIIFSEILFFDYCLREKPKSRPKFALQSSLDKQTLKEAYLSFGVKREEEGMHDIEEFSFEPVETAERGEVAGEPCLMLFSYENREAMHGGAATKKVSKQ